MTGFFFRQIALQLLKGNIQALTDVVYYKKWKKSLVNQFSPLSGRVPWMGFKTIDFLNTILKPDHKVFEYGGGGSTLFFLDRVKEVVTIEHDNEWFNILKENIDRQLLNKWTGRHVAPETGVSGWQTNVSDPDHNISDDPLFKGMSFEKYVSGIDEYPDNYFDLVLVDGRARPSCVKHAVAKIKPGGMLVLDNADRAYYLKYLDPYLQNFNLLPSRLAPAIASHVFTQTNIWVKTADV